MSTPIPASLKAADLTRFISRAAQLETVRPIIAYWCEYWTVNQILTKGLHNNDPGTLKFTTNLMDKLEQVVLGDTYDEWSSDASQIKAENSTNDAIIDDMAGQAYVEEFALETFLRADRVLKANKVTKQTANTFQAAATFFELINIWSPPDAEITAKIKYAKWNAIRILRALKEGKDPNESNPKSESDDDSGLLTLDQNDPEAEQSNRSTSHLNAFFEEVPDEQDIKITLKSQLPANESSILIPCSELETYPPFEPDTGDLVYDTKTLDKPLASRENLTDEIIDTTNLNEFPTVPKYISCSNTSEALPQQNCGSLGSKLIQNFESFPPPSLANDSSHQSLEPPYSPLSPFSDTRPMVLTPKVQETSKSLTSNQISVGAPVIPVKVRQSMAKTDTASIEKAQKHARWAISALNFEDTDTAVKELIEALKTLGCQ
ncbi:hypothetical protein BGHDH14_bgh00709 [Blumeria hordei DH14]|uniref:Uncharacterized protein n=1 Tax=Blumeria graminis f. sp. hordei (strain DH14) TaxID=546991 RepID=N1J7I8_BLUG1|nr:hypothetical protein BGHDH14_bgh00709 [Blumeria hordei DH14]